MDFNFFVNSVEFSLKTMCAVKINCEILLAIRPRYGYGVGIVSRAKENISRLQLPTSFKNNLKNLIGTVNEQLNRWSVHFNWQTSGKLIWTPQGSVNIIKCVEDILEDASICIFIRFLFACTYCMDKYIFQTWRDMKVDTDADQNHLRHLLYTFPCPRTTRRFAEIWFQALLGKYTIDNAYVKGFRYALYFGRDVETQCYSGKVLSSEVYNAVEDFRLFKINISPTITPSAVNVIWLHNVPLSPSTLCCIFARLKGVKREVQRKKFEQNIIERLLQWPYHPLFLKAVDPKFTRFSIVFYLSVIYDKIQTGCKVYDYCNLMEEVWKLAALSCSQLTDPLQFRHSQTLLSITIEHLIEAFVDGSNADPKNVSEFLMCSQTWVIFMLLVEHDEFTLFEKLLLNKQNVHEKASVEILKEFKGCFLNYMRLHYEDRAKFRVANNEVCRILNEIIEHQELAVRRFNVVIQVIRVDARNGNK